MWLGGPTCPQEGRELHKRRVRDPEALEQPRWVPVKKPLDPAVEEAYLAACVRKKAPEVEAWADKQIAALEERE